MKVYTLLPSDAQARLTAALGSPAALVRASDEDGLVTHIGTTTRGTVVIDPKLVSPTRLSDIVERLMTLESYVVVYTSLTPDGIQASLPFLRANRADVVLRGYDDSLLRLQQLLRTSERLTAGERVIAGLERALVQLPSALKTAIGDMLTNEGAIDSTKRLAAAAHMTRRSLDRWMDKVGIASARLLVATPKVIRAFTDMRHSDLSVARMATRLGFSSSRPLEQHCWALLGVHANELRNGLTTDEVVSRVVERLLMRASISQELE